MKERRRKIPLEWSPEVSTLGDQVVVTTGSRKGPYVYNCSGTLSASCAARLIVELRTAIRKIRDERRRYFDNQVNESEKPLP